MPRWRTKAVALVVMGGAAGAGLAACADERETYQRNGYATREDCLKDYPPEQCQTAQAGSGFMFLGPWYMANRLRAPAGDPGPGLTAGTGNRSTAAAGSASDRRQTATAGGFGATGRNSGFRGG